MPEIYIKDGREKSIHRRHPWIFSGAIAKVTGDPKIGETVDVLSVKGEFLARASYNPISNITGRIWTWDENEQVNPSMLDNRLQQAIALRKNMMNLLIHLLKRNLNIMKIAARHFHRQNGAAALSVFLRQ
jgi:23S rRNA (cytosine1962-C5)-methyltransferase